MQWQPGSMGLVTLGSVVPDNSGLYGAIMSSEPNKIDSDLSSQFPLQILLVDDNTINIRVGQLMLKRMGYQPATAASGQEALIAAEKQAFDIVFMDVEMPVMDGLQNTRQLRELPEEQRPKVVVAMTGNVSDADRQRAIDAGMSDYITKPIRAEIVQTLLKKWAETLRAS
jgi:CheY-like chemotaxis protein